MPIADFNGDTFVAFTDISGFKELMKNDQNALEAIKYFYQSGYNVLQERDNNVDGFFVSDCGILFARNGSVEERLRSLLNCIKKINQRMLRRDYMLTTSISYGNFNYQGKIEFEGIEKNPIYGGAYVKAFLNNETGKPKLQPGQCRLMTQDLPDFEIDNIPLLLKKPRDNNHYYYYWNIENQDQIEEFERKYKKQYIL